MTYEDQNSRYQDSGRDSASLTLASSRGRHRWLWSGAITNVRLFTWRQITDTSWTQIPAEGLVFVLNTVRLQESQLTASYLSFPTKRKSLWSNAIITDPGIWGICSNPSAATAPLWNPEEVVSHASVVSVLNSLCRYKLFWTKFSLAGTVFADGEQHLTQTDLIPA